jgi:hypothetical protein
VLREDHHNCDDNGQTDEVFRKAASALFFLHIRSSMQAHGEIRYDTCIVPAVFMGRHGHRSLPQVFPIWTWTFSSFSD